MSSTCPSRGLKERRALVLSSHVACGGGGGVSVLSCLTRADFARVFCMSVRLLAGIRVARKV